MLLVRLGGWLYKQEGSWRWEIWIWDLYATLGGGCDGRGEKRKGGGGAARPRPSSGLRGGWGTEVGEDEESFCCCGGCGSRRREEHRGWHFASWLRWFSIDFFFLRSWEEWMKREGRSAPLGAGPAAAGVRSLPPAVFSWVKFKNLATVIFSFLFDN